ncbi:RidA family protein [Haloarchaeobius sp. HRN-SO-5]|uniref:RidA family protein n=1 Tax=Haloarchaeobius sp. HRN-SO-5 TaxID=3446118 RepID=UPI003EBBAD9C
MEDRVIESEDLVDSTGIGYSQGRVVNGVLYTSGQVGWDADFEVAGEDVESQTRRAFENVEILLSEVDRDLTDVVKVTGYVVDPATRVESFLDVWNEVFDEEPYPCLTIIGVDQLAQESFLVEVEAEVPLE